MKLRFVTWNLLLLCAFSATNTDAEPAESLKRIDSGTYASLQNGSIKVLGYTPKNWLEVAEKIEFVKLKEGGLNAYLDAAGTKAGGRVVTRVRIPDTFFCFILLNGVVQPVIVDENKGEVWQIKGLGSYFSKCRRIGTDQKQIGFSMVAGLHDVWPSWSFDFSDKKQGLIVRFKVEGGW